MAIYWDTVARCMMQRAIRDAKALNQVLYLLQAADTSKPLMPRSLAAKLANTVNPAKTGGLHGMLPLHIGMHVRLLEHLDVAKGLVKDAEGTVVHVEVNPADADEVESARRERRPAYLRRVPQGIWLRMVKYSGAAFADRLQRETPAMSREDAVALVFVEPQTSDAFHFRGHTVVRTSFPLSHSRVITSTACQGRTMRAGVIVDAGRRESGAHRTDDVDYWLHLYVMLSRATRLEDLLLVRAPPVEFLASGPPEDLARQLHAFASRTERCRDTAARLAAELGLRGFLRD